MSTEPHLLQKTKQRGDPAGSKPDAILSVTAPCDPVYERHKQDQKPSRVHRPWLCAENLQLSQKSPGASVTSALQNIPSISESYLMFTGSCVLSAIHSTGEDDSLALKKKVTVEDVFGPDLHIHDPESKWLSGRLPVWLWHLKIWLLCQNTAHIQTLDISILCSQCTAGIHLTHSFRKYRFIYKRVHTRRNQQGDNNNLKLYTYGQLYTSN